MKKILVLFFVLFFIQVEVNALNEKNAGIGAKLIKDQFNHKTIVLQVYPNSPAEKAGLPIGANIVKINDKETKKLSLDEINSLLQGSKNTPITLTIKTFSFWGSDLTNFKGYKSKKVEIVRDYFDIPISKYDTDNKFLAHWQQVAPIELSNVDYIPPEVDIQLSRNYRIINDIYAQNYWYSRRMQFQKGYDTCLSYNKNEQNSCLMNLVNREVNKTSQDMTTKNQEQMIRLQKIQTLNQIDTNYNLYQINRSIRGY